MSAPPGVTGPSPTVLAALAEATEAFTQLRRLQARCYHALQELETTGAAAETGHRATRRLVEEHVRLDAAEARRLLRQAEALSPRTTLPGEERPPSLPATAALVEDGVIGTGHVAVVERTMRAIDRLPHVDPSLRATCEEQLAALATDRSPAALADAATEILALVDPDGAAPEDGAVPDDELHLLRRRNGALVGTFRYTDPVAAQTILAALEAATPPPGADGDTGPEPLRGLAQRRAQAFLDLASEGLTRGVDHEDPDEEPADEPDEPATDDGPPPAPPPRRRPDSEGGERVHLAVTMDWDLLRSRVAQASLYGHLPGLGRLDMSVPIGPETARRLACDADVVPAVLGVRSETLDVGRRTRVVPAAMRRALVLRDRRCAHPGCRRRARKCAAHHVEHWAHGGATAVDNLVLLCSFHHALVHHGGWTIVMQGGLPWFVPPRWLDLDRRPRHNRPWRPDDAPPLVGPS